VPNLVPGISIVALPENPSLQYVGIAEVFPRQLAPSVGIATTGFRYPGEILVIFKGLVVSVDLLQQAGGSMPIHVNGTSAVLQATDLIRRRYRFIGTLSVCAVACKKKIRSSIKSLRRQQVSQD
jgi:hypothetical protein